MSPNRKMSAESENSFKDMSLDVRLVKALDNMGITKPTLIQENVIPFGIQGKDVLAKAKTGSGKTLAYVLPLLHRLLTETTDDQNAVRAMILVPTLDLSHQVEKILLEVMAFCPKDFKIVNLANDDSVVLQKSLLKSGCNVIVSTPSRVLPHVEAKALNLKTIEILVIDEADLILGFGYGPDMENIYAHLPQAFQSYLMSASITPEVEELKQLILRNAVTFKLEDDKDEQENLKQFTIETKPEDKFLLLYVILKLKLLKGKMLVFVSEVDRSYRLKLFLDQFGIRSCVLNSELPLASRHNIVDEYNKGIYDLLIASDSAIVALHNVDVAHGSKKRKISSKKSETSFGVARGIDFKRVDVVLNFDLPLDVESYIHRIGRTARNGQFGTAISFVSESDEDVLDAIKQDVLDRIGKDLAPYAFDMSQIEGFRYRTQDAMRAVTGAMIKEARIKDLKREIMASEKLKTFFDARPKDLEALKHDKDLLHPSKVKPHLKHVPDYLVSKSNRKIVNVDESETLESPKELTAIPQNKINPSRRQVKSTRGKPSSKSKDPLKSFKISKSSKK